MFQKIHITKGSGKLGKSDTCDSAINSINVNTLTNEYCINYKYWIVILLTLENVY